MSEEETVEMQETAESGGYEPAPRKNLFQRILDLPNVFARNVRDWACGTPEHPLYPYCFRAKVQRWYRANYKGWCWRYTTWYDKAEDVYKMDIEFIKKSELSKDAVHITGKKNCYHIDLDVARRGMDSSIECGFTAVDAFVYSKQRHIDEALYHALDGDKKDNSKVYLYVCLAIGGLIGIYMFLKGGLSA